MRPRPRPYPRNAFERFELGEDDDAAELPPPAETYYAISELDGAIASSELDGARATFTP